jgi:hypothetical protein
MPKSYKFTKLRPLSVRINAILYVKYWLNKPNIAKKTPKSKPCVVLVLSLTVCTCMFADRDRRKVEEENNIRDFIISL